MEKSVERHEENVHKEVVYVPKDYIPEEEETVNIKNWLRVIRRWIWILPLSIISVAVGTFIYLDRTEPVYEARVKMVYEKGNPINSALPSLEELNLPKSNDGPNIDVLNLTLASPDVADRITIKTTKVESELSADQIKKLVKLSSKGAKADSGIFELSAQGSSPLSAASLAQAAAETLIDEETKRRTESLKIASEFLLTEMESSQKCLKDTEEKLSQFGQREGIASLLSENSSGLLGQLGILQDNALEAASDVEKAKAQLKATQRLIDEKKKELPAAQGEAILTIEQLRSNRSQIQSEFLTKQQRLTDSNPDMINLKERIATIDGQLKDEVKKLEQSKGVDSVSQLTLLYNKEIDLEISAPALEEQKIVRDTKVEEFRNKHPQLATEDAGLLWLKRQRSFYEQSYFDLQKGYTSIRLQLRTRVNDFEIRNPASEATAEIVKPKKRVIWGVGLTLSLLLGLGLTFGAEFLDDLIRDAVKTRKEAERLTGLQVLGVIPQMSKKEMEMNKNRVLKALKKTGVKNNRKKEDLINLRSRTLPYFDPKSPVVESYRKLVTRLRFTNGDAQSILVTSTVPDEGKTSVATGLATMLARLGPTALVDGDLRRPKIHEIFGLQNSTGLVDLITNEDGKELSSFIRATFVENLWVITSGKELPPDQEELLTQKIEEIIKVLKKEFKFIIFDSPPDLVADASFLAPKMDSTLLVVRTGSTRKPAVVKTKDTLVEVGANMSGIVLTFMDARDREEYPYPRKYDGYYYKRREE